MLKLELGDSNYPWEVLESPWGPWWQVRNLNNATTPKMQECQTCHKINILDVFEALKHMVLQRLSSGIRTSTPEKLNISAYGSSLGRFIQEF